MRKTVFTSAIILALFLGLIHPGSGGQSTEDQIRKLLKNAQDLGGSGQYAKALESVRPLAEQAGRFADKPELQYEVLDYEHFLLLKTGAFREALQIGIRIEELGRRIGDRKSPWDCLKIADAYLGLKDYDKALDWVEKAVKERGFAKLDTLQGEKFAWKIGCTFKGWGDDTAKLYRVNSTPSTWLIDRQGILRGVNLSGDTLTKAIVALL